MKELLLELLQLETVLELLLTFLKAEGVFFSSQEMYPALPKKGITLSDQYFLKKILPKQVFIELFSSNAQPLYMATFVLRHRLVEISRGLEYLILKNKGLIQESSANFEEKSKYIGNNIIDCAQLLLESFDERGKELEPMVLGLSALGLHVAFQQKDRCRYFDHYGEGLCKEKSIHLYCSKHEKLAWWQERKEKENIEPEFSCQETMYAFYADLNNLEAYNENELKILVEKFWKYYAKSGYGLIKEEKVDLTKSLEYFNYPNLEILLFNGMSELRHRYALLATKTHPDQGGEHENFIVLHEHYRTLKSQFSLRC